MRSLRHPHIVELHFNFRDDSHVYLGLEFAEGGGMFDLLSKQGKFSAERSAQHFYEVCDALEYLHTQKPQIIHRRGLDQCGEQPLYSRTVGTCVVCDDIRA